MDQNLHHLVTQVLQVTVHHRLIGTDPERHPENSMTHNKIQYLCTLCSRLLRAMIKGNVHYAMRISPYIPFLQSQVGSGINVFDTIMQIFKDNRMLLEQMTEEVLDCFVQLAVNRQFQHLNFLAELCVCDGHGIPKNQRIICDRVMKESDLLLQMRLHEGKVCACAHVQTHGALRPLEGVPISMCAWASAFAASARIHPFAACVWRAPKPRY